MDAAILAEHPYVAHWPFAAALAGPDGTIDPEARSDGLHLDPDHAEQLSRTTLFGLLRDSFRDVWSRAGTGLRAGDRTTWSAG
jgi:hypothetical protein